MKLITCVLSLILIALQTLMAKDVNVKKITYAQGLSENTVMCIAQDTIGFIWIGTREGLNRYDGYVCHKYYPLRNSSGGLGTESVKKIFVDNINNIWVCHSAGIDRYVSESDSFQPLGISYKGLAVKGIKDVIEAGGLKWVASSNQGLVGVDVFGDEVVEQIAGYESVSSFCKKDDAHFWVSGDKGVKLFNAEQRRFVSSIALPLGRAVCCWKYYKDLLWMYDYNALWVYDQSEWYQFKDFARLKNCKQSEEITGIGEVAITSLEVADNKLWVSTDGNGIYSVDLNRGLTIDNIRANSEQSISTNAIRCMYADRDQNVWIGTVHNGLNLIPYWQKKFYNLIHQIEIPDVPNGNFSSFLEDKNHQLWAASFDGLCQIDQNAMRIERYVAKGAIIN